MNKVKCLLLVGLLVSGLVARADSRLAVAETLDTFHRAAAGAEIDNYFAVMTEDVVFLGTDGNERWQGRDFRTFVQAHFEEGRGWRYDPLERNILLAQDGQTAWFDEMLRNADLGLCRGSGVLVKSGGGWKIAQYNLSVPVPNALVSDVVAQIAALDGSAGPADDLMPEGEPAEPHSAAVAAQASAGENLEAESTRSECKRKRFKTNRRAGC